MEFMEPDAEMVKSNKVAHPGLTDAGVAKRLFLSERTVEAHVRQLLGKLDIAGSGDAHRRVLAVLAYLRADRSAASLSLLPFSS